MKKNPSYLFKAIFVIALLMNLSLQAQQFGLFDFDTTSFPNMKVSFYAKMSNGHDIININKSDFNLWENGVSMNSTLGIDCSKLNYYTSVAVQLMLDNSSSMSNVESDGLTRIDWIKAGALAFLDSFHLEGQSLVAMNSFASNVVSNSGLQSTKQPVKDWISNTMKAVGTSTNIGSAFLQTYPGREGGLVELMSAPKDLRKVAILFTDGDPDPPSMWTQKIIDSITTISKREKIQVFAIFISVPMVNPDIQKICQQTGGQTLVVNSKQEIIEACRKIVGDIQSRDVCRLTWTSAYGCDEAGRTRDLKVNFNQIPDSVVTQYLAPASSLTNLNFSSNELLFGKPGIGISSKELTISSPSSDITILKEIFKPENGKYKIDWMGNKLPFVINKGDSIKIKINYIDSANYNSDITQLAFDAIPCKSSVINLIAPCGGIYPDTVKFGTINYPAVSDTIFSCVFKNYSDYVLQGDCEISGPDSSKFVFISGHGPFSLKHNECLPVVIRFITTDSNSINTAYLKYNIPADCGSPVTILQGNSVKNDLTASIYDFQSTLVNFTKDLDIIITNNYNHPIQIDDIKSNDPDNIYFIVKGSKPFPVSLKPGDVFNLAISFKPTELRTYKSVFGIYSSGNIIDRFTLSGTGSLTDVKTVEFDDKLIVSPNPVCDFLNLQINHRVNPMVDYSKIKIYSIEGIEVYSEPSEGLKPSEGYKIDVSRFTTGVYYVKVGDRVCSFVKI